MFLGSLGRHHTYGNAVVKRCVLSRELGKETTAGSHSFTSNPTKRLRLCRLLLCAPRELSGAEAAIN